jgi:hypothetical protein
MILYNLMNGITGKLMMLRIQRDLEEKISLYCLSPFLHASC